MSSSAHCLWAGCEDTKLNRTVKVCPRLLLIFRKDGFVGGEPESPKRPAQTGMDLMIRVHWCLFSLVTTPLVFLDGTPRSTIRLEPEVAGCRQ